MKPVCNVCCFDGELCCRSRGQSECSSEDADVHSSDEDSHKAVPNVEIASSHGAPSSFAPPSVILPMTGAVLSSARKEWKDWADVVDDESEPNAAEPPLQEVLSSDADEFVTKLSVNQKRKMRKAVKK